MERSKDFIVDISVLVCLLVAGTGWLLGYNHGTKQASEQAAGGSQELTTNQVMPEESNEQTDSEKGKMTNQTIWDIAVGSPINDEDYLSVGTLHEGLVYASKKDENNVTWHYGYIDKDGNEVINFKYICAHDFSEGVASVTEDGERWGYIDKQGNWAIEPILDWAGDFKDGKAIVKIEVKYYSIDKEGNILEEID